MLNFGKLESEQPNAIEMFERFFREKFFTNVAIAILPNFDLAIGNVKVAFQSSTLYDFFDSIGYFATIDKYNNGTFGFSVCVYDTYDNENFNNTGDLECVLYEQEREFSTRKECEIFAFERTFELLEERLKEHPQLTLNYAKRFETNPDVLRKTLDELSVVLDKLSSDLI